MTSVVCFRYIPIISLIHRCIISWNRTKIQSRHIIHTVTCSPAQARVRGIERYANTERRWGWSEEGSISGSEG